jgi:hypothetical protein
MRRQERALVRATRAAAGEVSAAVPLRRRAVAAGLFAGVALLLPASRAQARDLAAAEAAKEARKAALRAAADESAKTGIGGTAFEEPEFSVGDDKSPNTHTRQDEGIRKQSNV